MYISYKSQPIVLRLNPYSKFSFFYSSDIINNNYCDKDGGYVGLCAVPKLTKIYKP
jgi:hypothetical protein